MSKKKILKGLKDAKEGKVTRVTSVEEFFKGLERERKKHPIRTFIHNIYYSILHFLQELPLNIKTFIQRGKRGWASSDTWGFDYYLAGTISKGLQYLKENNHSHPHTLTEGEWVDVLNEIIWTFETAKEISEGDTLIPNDSWTKKTIKQFKKNKNYKVLEPLQILRYQAGFELFRQYFHDLWD